ncbi:hypothetical protein GYH73_007460 [Bacillus megaterium]|nr:hypothetical protein [Priestia megaterium]
MSENKSSQYKEENMSTPSRPLEYKERANESKSTRQMLRSILEYSSRYRKQILHIIMGIFQRAPIDKYKV